MISPTAYQHTYIMIGRTARAVMLGPRDSIDRWSAADLKLELPTTTSTISAHAYIINDRVDFLSSPVRNFDGRHPIRHMLCHPPSRPLAHLWRQNRDTCLPCFVTRFTLRHEVEKYNLNEVWSFTCLASNGPVVTVLFSDHPIVGTGLLYASWEACPLRSSPSQ